MTTNNTVTRGGHADVCSSKESKELDGNLKTVSRLVFHELKQKYPSLTFEKRFRSEIHQAGCEPDGGLFFYKGKLIVAAEAKHQGRKGNAIERWYKNAFVLRQLSASVTYITYATGEGAQENEVICKTLSPAHPFGFNIYNIGENVCYTSVDGFLPEVIYEGLKGAILDQIEAIFYE